MGLINYNIPPWILVKKKHLMLVLLVLKKHRVKKMEIYLTPLINELQLLWSEIRMDDIFRPFNSHGYEFILYGILRWCTHDFPRFTSRSSKNSDFREDIKKILNF
jgi:hypothetical protein